DVGMPALRPCVCALLKGINRAAAGRSVRAAVESHRGKEEEKPEVNAPVPVSMKPLVAGKFQVNPKVSPGFCGKSAVLTDFAVVPSQKPGTPFEAPSVKSTMMRRPD